MLRTLARSRAEAVDVVARGSQPMSFDGRAKIHQQEFHQLDILRLCGQFCQGESPPEMRTTFAQRKVGNLANTR